MSVVVKCRYLCSAYLDRMQVQSAARRGKEKIIYSVHLPASRICLTKMIAVIKWLCTAVYKDKEDCNRCFYVLSR